MSEDLLTRALTLGLIAIVVPLALRMMSGKAAATGRVRYSAVARWLVAVCALLAAAATALASASSQMGAARGAIALGAVSLLSLCAALEFWRVNHSYNDKGIEYRTSWSRHRSLAWEEIEKLKWRSAVKWLDLVPSKGARRIHLSPMLAGLEGLALRALEKVPQAALGRDPEALAALRLMAHGKAATLISDSRKPTVIAASLLGETADHATAS